MMRRYLVKLGEKTPACERLGSDKDVSRADQVRER